MQIKTLIREALREDGAFSDITTAALPQAKSSRATATLFARAAGVFSGAEIISLVLKQLDSKVQIRTLRKSGAMVRKDERLAIIRGRLDAILSGERVMLNLVGRMSGVATLTRRFVDAVKNTGAVILDTRKTLPLWRELDRQAVRDGGGKNHRFNLSDAVLVKDNHIAYLNARGIRTHAVYGADAAVRRKKPSFVAIEAKTLPEVWEAIKARPDIILLDNMAPDQLKGAILFVKAARRGLKTTTPYIEVSGGMTPARAAAVARLGVDRISVGALTHSAPALDISLEVD